MKKEMDFQSMAYNYTTQLCHSGYGDNIVKAIEVTEVIKNAMTEAFLMGHKDGLMSIESCVAQKIKERESDITDESRSKQSEISHDVVTAYLAFKTAINLLEDHEGKY